MPAVPVLGITLYLINFSEKFQMSLPKTQPLPLLQNTFWPFSGTCICMRKQGKNKLKKIIN